MATEYKMKRDRPEASLELAHGPPGKPADEPIERQSPGGQGDQDGLLDALLSQVGDRDRHEHDEQDKVPDPGLSPAWDCRAGGMGDWVSVIVLCSISRSAP